MFEHVLVFESDFIQIGNRGGVIRVHSSVQMAGVGIACTSPTSQCLCPAAGTAAVSWAVHA